MDGTGLYLRFIHEKKELLISQEKNYDNYSDAIPNVLFWRGNRL